MVVPAGCVGAGPRSLPIRPRPRKIFANELDVAAAPPIFGLLMNTVGNLGEKQSYRERVPTAERIFRNVKKVFAIYGPLCGNKSAAPKALQSTAFYD